MQQQISTLKQRKTLSREYKLRLTVILLLGLSALAVVFLLSLIPLYYFVQFKENLVNQQYDKVQKANIDQNEATLRTQVTEIGNLINLFKPISLNTELQKDLLSILPSANSGVKVTGMSWNKDKKEIFLKGQATTRNTLLTYVKTLQQDVRFSNAEVPVSNLTKSANLDFNLNLIYKK
ncbi:MAG: hypothetical protein WCF94_01805 [bacterium]